MPILGLPLKDKIYLEFSLPSLGVSHINHDGYSVAYKPITFSCILFIFIEMIFIHCNSFVMFAMKSMSMCND